MKEGWVCPKCGRALSPWTLECPCYIEPIGNQTKTNYTPVRDIMVNPKVDYAHHDSLTESNSQTFISTEK